MSIEDAIRKIIEEINNEPYIFRNEKDIHAMLYNELLKSYLGLFPIDIDGYKTRLVHCEYFWGKDKNNRHNKKRIDLVVFDEKDVRNINNNWLTKGTINDYEIVDITDAIEVKVELGGTGEKRKSLPESDIKKLTEFKEIHRDTNLHFIYIVRWPTKNQPKQDEIKGLVTELREECNKGNVKFYTNNNYFLSP